MMRNTTHQISQITQVRMKTLFYWLKKFKKSCYKLLPDWELRIHQSIKLLTPSLTMKTFKIMKIEISKKMIKITKNLLIKICWSKVLKSQSNHKMNNYLLLCKRKRQRISSNKHWKNKKMLLNNKVTKMIFSQLRASWKRKKMLNKNNLKISLNNSWKRWNLKVKN